MASDQSELEKRITAAAANAVDKSITESLTSYNGPLKKLCDVVIENHSGQLHNLIDKSFSALLDSDEFNEQLKISLNKKLASTIIGRFGGELESTVNKLKADPTTRAKIVVAIDSVISSQLSETK